MKTIKRLTAILSLILLTSCGASWQLSTLNHDPIYDDENYIVVSDDVKIDTLNEFQFRNRLRTDFNFRLDFAQYALSQPRSFDWNNRILGNRYNWNRNNWGYSYYSYWDRDQMWNDWAWGYTGWNSWGSPHRWSPFGYDRWGYGIHYGWNNHGWGYNNWMGNAHWGWNNYYGWNGYYNDWGWRQRMNDYAWQNRNRSNTVRVNGRRGSISNAVVSNRRVINNNIRPSNTRIVKEDNKEILILRGRDGKPVKFEIKPNNNTKPRGYSRPELNNNNNNRSTNTRTRPIIRNNNTRPSYNNSRPSTNTRPTINNNNNTRSRSTNVNRSNSKGGNSNRKN